MIHIKRFIDRVSVVESKHGKDFVMPIIEARGLRDELEIGRASCRERV